MTDEQQAHLGRVLYQNAMGRSAFHGRPPNLTKDLAEALMMLSAPTLSAAGRFDSFIEKLEKQK